MPFQEKEKRSNTLDGKSIEKNVFYQRLHILGSGMVIILLDDNLILNRNLPTGNQQDEGGKGHDSQSTQLKQDQNNHLPHRSEIGRRILNDQTSHTDCRRAGEQGIHERYAFPGICADRQYEQECSDKNGPDETQRKQLGRLKPYFSPNIPLLLEVNVLLPLFIVKHKNSVL